MTRIDHFQHYDARIGYRDDGAGRPLMLLHGTGGDGESNFAGLVPHLPGHRILRPDYAGSGLTSDPARRLTLDHLVAQVLAAADHAGVARFDLFGFSLGAAVATRLAAQHPERVDRLVLVGGFVTGHDPRARMQFAHWAELARRDPASLARLMLLTGFSHAFLAEIPDMEAMIAEMVTGGNWEGTARQAELDGRVDVSADLAAVQAPTLVLGNRCDQMVAPRASVALARGIARAELGWLDGPHLALMEDPAGVAARVNQTFG